MAPVVESPPAPPEGERLQKVLAAAGVASRRASEELIAQGRVRVNGVVVRVQGTRVDAAAARIDVDGERINVNPSYEYIVLNKPKGVVSTARDPQGRRTVLDLVRHHRRVYPVGRLDSDTTGLVLLTSHGELAHRLAHPRFEVMRTYVAEVKGVLSDETLGKLCAGIRLEDGLARARAARTVHRAAARSQVEIVMAEGRNHEVRRMFEAMGHPVLHLARTAFGPLELGTLQSGKSRRLGPAEVGELLSSVGL